MNHTFPSCCLSLLLVICPTLAFAQSSSEIEVSKEYFPSIHFYPKSTKLSDEGHNKVKAVARFLNQHPTINIEVRGYSDAKSNRQTAKNLARKRAKKVYIALMGEKVSANRVQQTVILPKVRSSVDTATDRSKRQVDFAILSDYACDHIDISAFIEKKAKKYDFYKNMAGCGELTKSGLRYSIQIASVVSTQQYNHDLPGRFTVREEQYGQFTRYMVGKYPTFCQAIHWWDEMSQYGVEDVWIVAYFDGVRLSSLRRARKLLKVE